MVRVSQLTRRYTTRLVISIFAFVATHNHFVLDRGGKVFKQSAPVIKLPEGASVEDHLRLLGVLNSSVACFWLKQNSHNKGGGGIGGARFAANAGRNSTSSPARRCKDFPLPADLPLASRRGSRLDCAPDFSSRPRGAVADRADSDASVLDAAARGVSTACAP